MKKVKLTLKKKLRRPGLKLFCFVALLLFGRSTAFCEDRFAYNYSAGLIERWIDNSHSAREIPFQLLESQSNHKIPTAAASQKDIPIPPPSVIFYVSAGALITQWLRQRKRV